MLADFNAMVIHGQSVTLTDVVNIAFNEELIDTINFYDILPGHLPREVLLSHLRLLVDCIYSVACAIYPLTANAVYPPVAHGAEIDADSGSFFLWISDPSLPTDGPARMSFADPEQNRSRRH